MVASGQRKSQVVLGLSGHQYDLGIPSSSPSSKNAALSTAQTHLIPPTTRSRMSVDLPRLAASLNILAADLKLVKFKDAGRLAYEGPSSRRTETSWAQSELYPRESCFDGAT